MPAVPETFDTDTLLQVAVTAETGIVVQPLKVVVAAETLSVHVRLVFPPLSLYCTVAEDEPAAAPLSGSVEVNVIVGGAALMLCTLVAATCRVTETGPERIRPRCAQERTATNNIAILS